MLDAVQGLFGRFVTHYGAARMDAVWAGIKPDEIKRYWARRLFSVERRAISYALQNLPEHPPTIDEFLAACRRVPPVPFKALPLPKLTEDQIAKRLKQAAKLKQLMGVAA